METAGMILHRQFAQLFYAPFSNIIWKYPPYENTVYFTFDDGPYPPLTAPLLQLLDDLKLPATFFLSGESIFRYRRELADLDYGKHVIGSHFYHHVPLFGMDFKKLLRGINVTDELIFRHFNRLANYFRPPYGVFNRKIFPVLESTSKKMVLWTVMAYDFKWNANRVLKHLRDTVHPGDIIVFHDSPQSAGVLPEVLPPFVEHCRELGWRFGKIG
jgi:peptidoglycan/xylan/chitin deacetylase (PgdA/CDA1 family)